MLLRSSSTPILGSLLTATASSDSPGHHHHHHPQQPLERTVSSSSSVSDFPGRHVSFASPNHQLHHSVPGGILKSGSGFRRVLSDGNLESLGAAAGAAAELPGDVRHPSPMNPGARRPATILETIPSFSIYNSNVKDPGDEDEDDVDGEEAGEWLEKFVSIGDTIGGEFRFFGEREGVGMVEGNDDVDASPLFLAKGLGIGASDSSVGLACVVGGGGGVGGSSGGCPVSGNGGDRSELDAFYKQMVEENPSDALFLRNYAQFLYQTKGEPHRAEEYFSRAILAEPGDGETLSLYAKLIWELHHDKERASSYFEQAAQAAPQDSHVLAAYANFLWETEDGEDGDRDHDQFKTYDVPSGAVASARA